MRLAMFALVLLIAPVAADPLDELEGSPIFETTRVLADDVRDIRDRPLEADDAILGEDGLVHDARYGGCAIADWTAGDHQPTAGTFPCGDYDPGDEPERFSLSRMLTDSYNYVLSLIFG